VSVSQDSDNETELSVWSWLPGADAFVDIHRQNAIRYDQVKVFPLHYIVVAN